jgi:outer membrane lipoprotein carrier protein
VKYVKSGVTGRAFCKLLILLAFCKSSVAQDERADAAAVASLSALLGETQTLHAEVAQLQMDQDGRELQENRAQLVMQKPSSFSWEITEPYEELMVTDGITIWRYEPDLGQVTVQPFQDDVDRTPVMLLNGDADDIAASYEVSTAQMSATVQRFILLPRKSDRLFERLSLTFDGPVLQEMQFEDSLGQQTSLSFYQIRRNEPVAVEQFVFTPPVGVEVIDHTLE